MQDAPAADKDAKLTIWPSTKVSATV